MLLHNFILDERVQLDDPSTFNVTIDTVQMELTDQTGEAPNPIVVDNNEPRRRGRRTVEETDAHEKGDRLRRILTTKLATQEMRRPMQHGINYNRYGHIYITS